MATYPVDERNKANRYPARATYDKQALTRILAATPLVHVAFTAPSTSPSPSATDTFPTVLPMLAAHDPSEDAIYLHGSSASRLVQLTSASSSSNGSGLAVTISAATLDGYVLALSPFSHSVNYRSATIFGRATLLAADAAETMHAMRLVTDRLVPARWDNSRVPPTPSEVKQTGILKVRVETASCKVRVGGAHSERRDLKDEGLKARVWTGVVPAFEVLGEPVPDGENGVGEVPAYLGGWVGRENAARKAYAEGVAFDA